MNEKLKEMKQKAIPPAPVLKELDSKKEDNINNIRDQYIKKFKLSVRNIDNNLPLKRFIIGWHDKKKFMSSQKDQTHKDIKIFMDNYCSKK